MTSLPDLAARADTPSAARPVERIFRPDPLPRHPATARSPLGTGRGRGGAADEDRGATRAQDPSGGTRRARSGDAVSIRFLAQILGQDLRSARGHSTGQDSAASGSDAYRRHGGEPAPYPARAVVVRLIV